MKDLSNAMFKRLEPKISFQKLLEAIKTRDLSAAYGLHGKS